MSLDPVELSFDDGDFDEFREQKDLLAEDLISLEDDRSIASTVSSSGNAVEEEDDDDDDFFSEKRCGSDLPDHLRDDFLEQVEKQMNNLTLKDFEESQFDVHGISAPVEETPEMVEQALEQLDKEIQKKKRTRNGEKYRLAESHSKAFVSSKEFRLMFLRSTSFSSSYTAAAERIMNFFNFKAELWGDEKLTKRITLSDFGEDGLEAIRNGHTQLLPLRDTAGRSIIFNNLNHLHYKDDGMDQLRTIWYLLMTALEDEETQQKGLVVIQYKVGPQVGLPPSRYLLFKGCQGQAALPMKMCMHCCFGRSSLPYVRILKYGLETFTSWRVRVHEGSHEECRTALMAVGIPGFVIPVTNDGDLDRKYHVDWLKRRQLSEEADDGCQHVVVPKAQDVLFGRGRRSRFNPGNIRLNQRLEDNFDRYNKLKKRNEKREVVMEIVNAVKADGGRFLKQNDAGAWQVADDEESRLKVTHDFRTVRRNHKSVEKTKMRIIADHYGGSGVANEINPSSKKARRTDP